MKSPEITSSLASELVTKKKSEIEKLNEKYSVWLSA